MPFQQPTFLADDSENSSNDTDEVIFQGGHPSTTIQHSYMGRSGAALSKTEHNGSEQPVVKLNSCRALQKKLELKVERAKRNYKQLHQSDEAATAASSAAATAGSWDVCISQPKLTAAHLMPITRLQFPGREEQQTLIEYKEVAGDENGEDYDGGPAEGVFFGNKHKRHAKQDLSDTFSIQEMTIESDSEGSGSDTLELLSPNQAKFWDRTSRWFASCCGTKDF